MPGNNLRQLPDRTLENSQSTHLIIHQCKYNRLKYIRLPDRCLEITNCDYHPFNRMKLPNLTLEESMNRCNTLT